MSQRRLFISVFGLLALAQLVPIWAVRFHPLPDLGNHLAAVSIWHHLKDPAFDFDRYYTMSLGAAPYWGYYLLARMFAFAFGLDIANRIVLSLCVVALPVGFAWLAHRFGRSPWLGLFAFPLAWNFNFHIGFVTFCLGLTLLPFALIAFDAFCVRPTVLRALLPVALGLSLFFTHLLPWAMFLGCSGLMGLLHERRSRRELLPRLAAWLVPFLGGVLVIVRGQTLHMGKVVGKLAVKVYSYWGSIRDFHDSVLSNIWNGSLDHYLSLVLLATWLVMMVTARRGRLRLHELQPEACAIFLYASYIFLPRSILSPAYWWGINFRFAVGAALFAGLCVPGPIEGWRRWLLAPVIAVGFAFAIITLVHWERIEAWYDGMDELAKIPAHQDRVLLLAFPPWHEPTTHNFAQSSNAFRQAYYGGYSPDNFDEGFPLKYKQRFPAPAWRFPEQFNWERHARYYDWILAFQPPAGFLAAQGSMARPMGSAGNWKLWRLPPREDAPPAPPYPRDWAFDPRWNPPKK